MIGLWLAASSTSAEYSTSFRSESVTNSTRSARAAASWAIAARCAPSTSFSPGVSTSTTCESASPGTTVAGAVPADVPHILGPAAADIHFGHRLADQRIDQRRLAGADLAEHDDLDFARRQLLGHRVQLIEIALQRRPLFRRCSRGNARSPGGPTSIAAS